MQTGRSTGRQQGESAREGPAMCLCRGGEGAGRAAAAAADTASGTVGIDFSDVANTMREFLGFQGSGNLSAVSESSVYGSNVSKFNTLEYYKLEAVGLSISGGYGEGGRNDSNCIAVVIPNVSPSQLIVQRLAHPIKLHCNIAGATISQITWRLLDNNDQPVNTNSENFSARVRITY